MRPLTQEHRDALELATAEYQRQLVGDTDAMEYLESERWLSPWVIQNFRLGVVRDPVDPSHSRFRNMICIPNLSGADDEHPVGIKFRNLDPTAKKKYDQPDGNPSLLFNLRALNDPSDTVYVTEGEFDAIALTDCGLPAIAAPGTNTWKSGKHRWRLVEGRQVVLCRDSDEAALHLVKAMSANVDGLVVRDPSPYKDVNEMYRAGEDVAAWARGEAAA